MIYPKTLNNKFLSPMTRVNELEIKSTPNLLIASKKNKTWNFLKCYLSVDKEVENRCIISVFGYSLHPSPIPI